ncbi:hypothetical protein C8Q78DRAFT_1065378 [Trametes maxima]|nr:hypothetical protein C8Q78DRAFT_1065378 [Trametes maxima]
MSQDLFVPSLVGWFSERPDDVIRAIAEASRVPQTSAHDMFRPRQVDDATTRRTNAPAAAERLIRWDLRGPQEVFWTGFPPLVYPSDGQYPPEAFNLRDYVANNDPSIFVGTARFYRNDRGVLTRWQRRVTVSTRHRFEYDIYAYGGIDVNHVLGDHTYANQHEIAFPGGIRPELIHSAREYMDNTIIRVWMNTHFDNTVNAPNTPPLAMLPAPRRPPPGVPVVPYPPPDQHEPPADLPGHDELRRRRQAGEDEDLMHGEGEALDDPMFDVTAVPRNSVSCVLHPSDKGRAYFFCGNRYAAINIAPGSNDDTIAWGPKSLVDNWPSLGQAKFTGGVDAVLPNPRNGQEMYFFCMEQYALINIRPGTTSDYIVNGPKNTVGEWPSLRQAGFKTVDAVLPNPANSDEAYFFSGERYALINIKPGSNDDYIVNGPKNIVSEWPSLRKAGFKTVDAVLPNPSNSAEAYFFSGEQYALINIAPGSNGDYIVNGPKLVRTEWPSLHQAGFW